MTNRLSAQDGSVSRSAANQVAQHELDRLATGDLSFQLVEPFAPDFEALRHDLNSAVQQLERTLSSVSNAAGSIDTGTREISRGSNGTGMM